MNRTNLRYFVQESAKNFLRHPLVTIASLTTIALMLLILGAFLSFSMNATHVLDQASQRPPVEIYAKNEVSEDELEDIESKLEVSPYVLNFRAMSPQDNYDEFRSYLGEDSYVLDEFSPELLPYTFVVNLVDPDMVDEFTIDFEPINGVREVKYSGSIMEFFSGARRIVNVASFASLIVLGVIAFFIISNMVRVSVLARSQEIQIMKYVGATNLYIRIPYVIEGAVIGLIGAFLATVAISIAYDAIYNWVHMDGAAPLSLSLLTPGEIVGPVFVVAILIGILVGSLGSAVSVRRYIKV